MPNRWDGLYLSWFRLWTKESPHLGVLHRLLPGQPDSLVEYGTTTAYGSSAADSALTTSHTIILGTLTPSTAYPLRVTSKNGYGIFVLLGR
jgi:hypothetical protein